MSSRELQRKARLAAGLLMHIAEESMRQYQVLKEQQQKLAAVRTDKEWAQETIGQRERRRTDIQAILAYRLSFNLTEQGTEDNKSYDEELQDEYAVLTEEVPTLMPKFEAANNDLNEALMIEGALEFSLEQVDEQRLRLELELDLMRNWYWHKLRGEETSVEPAKSAQAEVKRSVAAEMADLRRQMADSRLSTEPEYFGYLEYRSSCVDDDGNDVDQEPAPDGDGDRLHCERLCSTRFHCSGYEWYEKGIDGTRCFLIGEEGLDKPPAAFGADEELSSDAKCYVKETIVGIVESSAPPVPTGSSRVTSLPVEPQAHGKTWVAPHGKNVSAETQQNLPPNELRSAATTVEDTSGTGTLRGGEALEKSPHASPQVSRARSSKGKVEAGASSSAEL